MVVTIYFDLCLLAPKHGHNNVREKYCRLAFFGGTPEIHTDEFIKWPAPDEIDLMALGRVIKSGSFHRVNHPIITELEEVAESWTGLKVRAVSSGGAALHICLDYLSELNGSVVCGALNWPGAVGPIFHANMRPRFVDVNLKNACIGEIGKDFTNERGDVAVLSTHLFGNFNSQYYEKIEHRNADTIPIIHDCAQAIGSAPYINNSLGRVYVALSGNGAKHLGAGELGLLCSNDCTAIDHVDTVSLSSSSRHGERVFSPHTKGFNFRPNVFSAAVALQRLLRIDDQIRVRKQNVAFLWKRLSQLPGILPLFDPTTERNSFLVMPLRLSIIREEKPRLDAFRDHVVELLQAENAPVSVWLRKPVWNYMHQQVEIDESNFPNTRIILSSMFHITEIGPPNGIAQMGKIAAAFEKIWDYLGDVWGK